jgi:hypothetical protein
MKKDFLILIEAINTPTPRTKAILAMLDPIILPMTISELSESAATIAAPSSGRLVPIETRVRPIIK